ncbi:DegT/DnrJ/EryC1/StrS family aminotransferase [bacterium]|nr:DegT/DnrJ/EryC1/StrS family aminotransferase [bacterium]
MIPLLDLQVQYEGIETAVLEAIKGVIASKQFIMGPDIPAFESELAQYVGVAHALGVSSGTDALLLALMALGIGPGDEVITSPFSFFATAGAIVRVGATPVFVDIDATYTINPALIESAITPRTKAIMPVHLFGQMADMDPIMAIAKRHGLAVIEDAAQAIGAQYRSQDGTVYGAGSMGDVGCFSFFPSKNLGGIGDGGAVTTQRKDVADLMGILRVHGAQERYYHTMVGGNFRLDTIQAAVLRIKLKGLEAQHEARIQNAIGYNQQLVGSGVGIPVVRSGGRMIYNQYTIQVADRDAVMKELATKGIGHAIYYPVPLHRQACFDALGYQEGDCPVAEKMATCVLSIPIYAGLSESQLSQVVAGITSAVGVSIS